MDEQQGPAPTDGNEVEPTGVAEVDQVLDQIARLGDVPVGEHVAVFERAQEQLRRALDAPPGA